MILSFNYTTDLFNKRHLIVTINVEPLLVQ